MSEIQNIIRRRGSYNLATQYQRLQVIRLKEQGFSLAEISNITGINRKTVQSINSVDRQKIYSEFEFAVIEDYMNIFIDNQELIGLSEKQQRCYIRDSIRKEFIYQTSAYQNYLQRNQKSQRKRILEKVVAEIHGRFQQHLIFKQTDEIINDLGFEDQQTNQMGCFDVSQSLQFVLD